jgi:hypothetical protein
VARPRQRLVREHGPRFDLTRLIPSGLGKPGLRTGCRYEFGSGETGEAVVVLGPDDGVLHHLFGQQPHKIGLVAYDRHFGGLQWYALCPISGRKARVLYRPPGAQFFASRHAWRGQVAYASQFEDVVARAWRTKAKIKARTLGGADPDEWDLPPKPKWIRRATYERLEARYDRAEERLDAELAKAAARFLPLL